MRTRDVLRADSRPTGGSWCRARAVHRHATTACGHSVTVNHHGEYAIPFVQLSLLHRDSADPSGQAPDPRQPAGRTAAGRDTVARLDGVFDRFPRLQIIVGHQFEALSWIAWRADYAFALNDSGGLRRTIKEYLRDNFYADILAGEMANQDPGATNPGWSLSFNAYQAMVNVIAIDRIVFTTDYPYGSMKAGRQFLVPVCKPGSKTAAVIRAIVVTAPEPVRQQLRDLPSSALVSACMRLRPDTERLGDPVNAAKAALRSIATRARQLELESRSIKKQLDELTKSVAPATSTVFGLGPDTTSALLVAIGDNPDRLRSEAAFAHLCGVAPIPASSGKTNRHRLHRGGDRSGNQALHIAVVVRLRYHTRARDYAARRIAEGLSMPEIIRCQKRYLAREVYPRSALTTPQ